MYKRELAFNNKWFNVVGYFLVSVFVWGMGSAICMAVVSVFVAGWSAAPLIYGGIQVVVGLYALKLWVEKLALIFG